MALTVWSSLIAIDKHSLNERIAHELYFLLTFFDYEKILIWNESDCALSCDDGDFYIDDHDFVVYFDSLIGFSKSDANRIVIRIIV